MKPCPDCGGTGDFFDVVLDDWGVGKCHTCHGSGDAQWHGNPKPPNEAGAPPRPPDGRKDDQGKRMYRLLPVKPVGLIVDVLTFGAKKYAVNNWQLVDDAPARYEDAMLRHIHAWQDGEKNDPESGLPHLAHAGCCLLFLMYFELETK